MSQEGEPSESEYVSKTEKKLRKALNSHIELTLHAVYLYGNSNTLKKPRRVMKYVDKTTRECCDKILEEIKEQFPRSFKKQAATKIWSPEEVKKLKDCIEKHMDPKDCTDLFPDRSLDAIKKKYKSLKDVDMNPSQDSDLQLVKRPEKPFIGPQPPKSTDVILNQKKKRVPDEDQGESKKKKKKVDMESEDDSDSAGDRSSKDIMETLSMLQGERRREQIIRLILDEKNFDHGDLGLLLPNMAPKKVKKLVQTISKFPELFAERSSDDESCSGSSSEEMD